jgi:hypothetical protein
MEKNNYKEELTEKMHSEFTVDEETEIKHRAWVVLGCVQDGADLAEMMKLYQVTQDDIDKNIDEFNSLQDNGE